MNGERERERPGGALLPYSTGVRSLFIGKSGASPHNVFRYLERGPRSRRRRNTSISFAA